jgi:maleylacetoacetate isomerase/maleylpyruvate isomerase
VLVQSSAILEWLEEAHPEPALLPKDPVLRAQIRGVAAIIGADTHPLTNAAGTLKVLRAQFGADDAAILKWLTTWTHQGFSAVETLIGTGPFCFGTEVTLADLYLVPQYFAAKRFNVPVDGFPKIARVVEACGTLDAFKRAAPDQQPDKE